MNSVDWPAQSPGVNPIEKLGGMLARNFYANSRQPETIAELATFV